MRIHAASLPSRARFNVRLQLLLAFGVLSIVLTMILAIMPMARSWMSDLVYQYEADQHLGQLADEIVVQTLLCRRFEKDILLNLDNPEERSEYVMRWQRSMSNLEQAIHGFDAAAVTIADRAQAKAWRTESANYRAGMLALVSAIDGGALMDSEEANEALVPAKASIRDLTDTAMATARAKESAAASSASALQNVISSNARMIVIFGLVAIVLCAALDRR
jgi:hypothetical protein